MKHPGITSILVLVFATITASGFPFALATRESINLNGNNLFTDSYNSHDPNLSNSNMPGYYDPNEASTNGNVASVAGMENLGNLSINGSLYLGPNASFPGSPGQVTGDIFYDYNLGMPAVQEPTTTWLTAPTTGNKYVFTPAYHNGYYEITSLTKEIVVAAGVRVTLMVNSGNLTPPYIDIQGDPTNSGTLIIYQRYGTFDLRLNEMVGGARPENFMYYGEPGVTGILLSGTAIVVGSLYAPQAVLSNSGGGQGIAVVGSVQVKALQLNGHCEFHYDEALNPAVTTPVIVDQPQSRSVLIGQNAGFSVSLFGPGPVNYQWRFNTAPVLNATNSSFTITHAQLTDAGNYTVVVANGFGSVTSSPAILTVADPRGNLGTPVALAGGNVQFAVSGLTGSNYVIQASSNFTDWIGMATNAAPFTFVETNADIFTRRFYRSVYLP